MRWRIHSRVNSLIYKEFLISVDILWIGQLRVCLGPQPCAQAAARQGRPDRRPRCPGTIATEHARPGARVVQHLRPRGESGWRARGKLGFCCDITKVRAYEPIGPSRAPIHTKNKVNLTPYVDRNRRTPDLRVGGHLPRSAPALDPAAGTLGAPG